MKERLAQLYANLTDSFWFTPAWMALLAACVALVSINVYQHLHRADGELN